jgi:hypothetical protein
MPRYSCLSKLKWIAFSRDRTRQHHRNADVRGLAMAALQRGDIAQFPDQRSPKGHAVILRRW